jgi:hypothetical protein
MEHIDGIIKKLLFFIRSWFYDGTYVTISEDKLKKLVNDYITFILESRLKYIEDVFDCDDFAEMLKCFSKLENGNSIGVAIGSLYYGDKYIGEHAWNIAILDDKKIKCIEPQTGEIFDCKKTNDGFVYDLKYVIW